jgi:hypothetical protein
MGYVLTAENTPSINSMNKAINEILKRYPGSRFGNQRTIVARKLESIDKYPSVSKAQELEEMGITVDFAQDDQIFDEPEYKK